MYEYKAVVRRVVDGDTLDLDVDLGMSVHSHQRIRILDLDTPEIYGVKKDGEEYARGKKSSEHMSRVLTPVGTEVRIVTHRDDKGKYGRYLAAVFVSDDERGEINVAREMIALGLGSGYEV